jgi:hypothetical protein
LEEQLQVRPPRLVAALAWDNTVYQRLFDDGSRDDTPLPLDRLPHCKLYLAEPASELFSMCLGDGGGPCVTRVGGVIPDVILGRRPLRPGEGPPLAGRGGP